MSSGTPANATPPNAPPAATGSAPPPAIQRPSSGHTMAYAVIAVVVVVIILVAGLGYAEGWYGKKTTSTSSCAPASTTVLGAGSTLVYPLMYFWSTTYKDSSVNYQGVGSTSGITDISGHSVDFGASDAPLTPAQRAGAANVMMLPEAAGAVVPIYDLPGVTATLNFTGAVLADIFDENITTWNNPAIQSINPGVTLPNATIIPVHRSDGSGTTFIFTSFLSADSPYWASKYGHATSVDWPLTGELSEPKNSGVAGTVAATPDTIGYVDINYALSNSIAYGAVQNPAGNYIKANVTNSASALTDVNVVFPSPTGDWYNVSYVNSPAAGDYPIVSYTYVLIYQDPGKASSSYSLQTTENMVDFLWWAVTVGQNYSSQLFYIPLPHSTVVFDENELKSMTFNGAAIPICTTTS